MIDLDYVIRAIQEVAKAHPIPALTACFLGCSLAAVAMVLAVVNAL